MSRPTALILILALIGASTLWMAQRRAQPAETDAAPPSTAVHAGATPAQPEPDPVPFAHTEAPDHAHAHPDAEALAQNWPKAQRADPFAGRFEPPLLRDAGHFQTQRTALHTEPGCQQQPELARTDVGSDAQSQLQTLYGIDPHERYPRDYFFRTLTQFWSLGGEHYQASAVWDIGMPPVYRLELHVSPTADFSRDVLAVPAAIAPPARADALAAGAWIAQLSALYQRQGALLGQRIVEAQVNAGSDADQGSADLVLVDAAVRRWTFAGGHCEAERGGAALSCRCVDPAEAGAQAQR